MSCVEKKKHTYDLCRKTLNSKMHELDAELNNIQNAANDETKSSAGDKYETGRAMLMLEKEKLAGQKEQLMQQIIALNQINELKVNRVVEFGSWVETSSGSYFISIGLGKFPVNDDEVYVISPVSPLAKKMMGMKSGDQFEMNDRLISINNIC